MTAPAVVRGALWAYDLSRIRQPDCARDDYAMVEVRSGRLASELARAMNVGESVVRDRLERGCRAFAAWSWADEAVVSWMWVSTGEEFAPPLRRMLAIPEGDCYGWDVGTVEVHRGQGLAVRLLEWAGRRMAELGAVAMWNGIDNANLSSRRAHVRAGFRPVLRIAALHEPPPGRLRTWAADYADERLVARARHLLGVGQASSRARRAA
jgi:GNAT superfamily N-acetyltransferase